MKRVLAVLDQDTDYAGELAAYACDRELTPFSVIAFDDFESLKRYTARQPVDVLLNGTGIPEEKFRELGIGQIIHLKEEGRYACMSPAGKSNENDPQTVCKYQAADGLFREVMRQYKSLEGNFPCDDFKSEIIGICSPIGRCGKTGFAVTLGRILAERCKVLYLNLEGCSGLSALTDTSYNSSLSDVIYALRQGTLNEGIVGSALYQIGKLDYIAPVSCAEDLEEIRADELADLAGRLVVDEHYKVVVIDAGDLGRNAFPLLERCGVIYAPMMGDAVSQAKMAEWKEQLLSYGGEDLLGRVRLVELPATPSGEEAQAYFDALFYGEMGRLAGDLFFTDT